MSATTASAFFSSAAHFKRLIGLAGGIASGKSNALEFLTKAMPAVSVDADKAAHSVYAPGGRAFAQMQAAFPEAFVDDKVERAKLGQAVFANPAKLQQLNSIVWPATTAEVDARLLKGLSDGSSPSFGLVEAALLIEAGWCKAVDEVWVTYVPREEVKRRLKERNGLSDEEAERRLAAQAGLLRKLMHAHRIFDTSAAKEVTREKLGAEVSALQEEVAHEVPLPSQLSRTRGAGRGAAATLCEAQSRDGASQHAASAAMQRMLRQLRQGAARSCPSTADSDLKQRGDA